jgi:hypothetical protein
MMPTLSLQRRLAALDRGLLPSFLLRLKAVRTFTEAGHLELNGRQLQVSTRRLPEVRRALLGGIQGSFPPEVSC